MLLFIQSLLVYGMLAYLMYFFGVKAYNYQYPFGLLGFKRQGIANGLKLLLFKTYFLFPIFIFCLVASLRFQVGVDTENYKHIFYDYLSGYDRYFLLEKGEIGFKYIIDFSSFIIPTHYLYLFLLAFLQIMPLYYGLCKHRYYLPFLGIALIFSESFFSLMNIMRQGIAACILVAIVILFLEKKWIKVFFLLILAISFHKSAFIIIPIVLCIYPFQKGILDTKIQLLLFFLSFLLMDKLNVNLLSLSSFAGGAGYDVTQINGYSNLEATTKSIGPVLLLQYMTYFIAIIYSKRMAYAFNSKLFNVFYNLFLLGTCLFVIFYNDFTVQRLLYYFRLFSPIVVSALLFLLWQGEKKGDRKMFMITILLMFTYLLWELYKGTMDYPHEYVLYKFDL